MIILAIACLFVGYWIGWINAHVTVATECEMLGRFYVGEAVFECVKIEKEGEPQK